MATSNRRRVPTAPQRRPRTPVRAESGRLVRLLADHRDTLGESLRRLVRAPIDTLMTVFVIAIALLLPGLFSLLADNLGGLGARFEQSARVTLFLAEEVGEEQARQLSNTLLEDPAIESVDYLSREAALEEFQARSDFAAVLAELGENPLPASLVIRPAATDPGGIQALVDRLGALPEAESLGIDLLWIQRLDAIHALLDRSAQVLRLVLSVAVLLIVGNTLRTTFESRQREIEVMRLVGGTAGYIARPFLYTGLLLGLLGAATALVLLTGIQLAVRPAMDNLLSLYGAAVPLQTLSGRDAMVLLGSGSGLGWLGAALSTAVRLYSTPP